MADSPKKDIRQLSDEQIANIFSSLGEKTFRAKQLTEWLWQKGAFDFNSMTNLSQEVRKFLSENYAINQVCIDHSQRSNDGTLKSAFRLYDDHKVEGVLIPTSKRLTACISSQVGCSLTCKFCATGYLDRKRNLDYGEIFDQVVLINRQAQEEYGRNLTNIVYMGMGEPLLNYSNVVKSIDKLTSTEGLNMSPSRITVSTAGVAKMIKKFGDDGLGVNLALSLHAANDLKRNQIMPVNETNALSALAEALAYYYDQTKLPVTYEYILFYDFNDSIEDAEQLLKFIRRVPSKVNIIEYNPIEEASFRNTDPETLDRFSNYLTSQGVNVRVRRSRGKDIDAACGQLANKEVKAG